MLVISIGEGAHVVFYHLLLRGMFQTVNDGLVYQVRSISTYLGMFRGEKGI